MKKRTILILSAVFCLLCTVCAVAIPSLAQIITQTPAPAASEADCVPAGIPTFFATRPTDAGKQAAPKAPFSTATAKTRMETFFHYKTLADSSLRAAVIELGLTTDARLERIRPICADMDVSCNEYYHAINKLVPIDPDFFMKAMLAPGDCRDEMLFDARNAVPQKACRVTDVTEIERAPYGDTDRIDYRVKTADDTGAVTVYRVRFVQYAGEYCIAACDVQAA